VETLDLSRLDDDAHYEQAIRLLATVTDELLDDVRDLDDDGVRARSRCPGWSRGHVLTHLARNADGLCNLLHWARTGEETPMYASREARNQDIDDGSGRSAAELEADLDASAERLLAGIADLPADHRQALVRSGAGHEAPAREVLWWRIREVSYHHVDLDTGQGFRQLPPAVVARGLPEAVERVAGTDGAPGLTLEATDLGATWQVGDGGQRVRGPAAELLGWLTGREDGAELSSDAPLPTLPPWG
jgi:maleylpyruvate isomerase